MRLLHVIHSVDPAGGGPIEAIKQLAAVNISLGHNVEVASLDHPSSRCVDDCPLKCHALGPGWGVYGYAPRLVPWLKQHAGDYDAVIIDGLWNYSSFGTWRALRNAATPYFVFVHGMLDPWFNKTFPLKRLKKRLYWRWAEYRVLRDARAVLFTCEEERKLASLSFRPYKCQQHVVRYGTPGPGLDYPAEKATEAFTARFPNSANRRRLLFLGRIHVKKGTDLLLRAFAKLLTEVSNEVRPTLHLVMAGPIDHEYGRKMKVLATELMLGDSVTWTGMLRGAEKWQALRSSEAFILPSHQENFGISVTEALACGVPVLISNKVNIWSEIVSAGGGLAAADTEEGTLKLLRLWVYCPQEELLAMTLNAKRCFEKHFHINAAAASLIKTLEASGVT